MKRNEPQISPQKLLRISAAGRLRYLQRLLADATEPPHRDRDAHLVAVLRALAEAPHLGPRVPVAAREALALIDADTADQTEEGGAAWRHARAMVEEALADAADRSGGALERLTAGQDAAEGTIPRTPVSLPIVIYIPHLRSPFNLGNIIRSAGAFGICGVVVDVAAPDPDHPRCLRAAMGAARCLSVVRGNLAVAVEMVRNQLSVDGRGGDGADRRDEASAPDEPPAREEVPVLVLETGGHAIDGVTFPPCGVLVVGHEELGVPVARVGSAQDERQVITIPHEGCKESLNVGVAAGIALSWWTTRR